MKYPSIIAAAALQLAAPAAASFYIYIGNDIRIGMENRFWFSRGRPSCDAIVLPNSSYPLVKSISGAAQGVACEGHLCESRWTCEGTNCHQTDPQDIDKVEMNTSFGHYTIYKSRGWNLYDQQDSVVGKCTPTDVSGFSCVAGVPGLPVSAKSLFWCDTSVW
ncbi:hypothetical protein B0T24DRAFT_681497 [Lasiosphaeria ovina]|uniref:Uncharacterized protein n=1 Tax=Lasiosphaeria ovina TaxID=92902 RepID=A0AAE0N3F4_9PEZI|nr:hypothetical protein B0T24DRAFT_681497 [Lasiosphaeria ovina]